MEILVLIIFVLCGIYVFNSIDFLTCLLFTIIVFSYASRKIATRNKSENVINRDEKNDE